MSSKRASMREGPLAALFRKTEHETTETPPAPPAQEPREAVAPTPPPATQAAASAHESAHDDGARAC